jgi:CheY-like chemotaxis protein
VAHGPAQPTRKHIFCINSSPAFLAFLRELLQGEQYNVTTTNFVPQTFDQIMASQPDLLIIDLAYGQGAGWDLLAALEQEAITRHIPVIATSTDAALLALAEERGATYGADAYLVKPLAADDLLAAVRARIGPA